MGPDAAPSTVRLAEGLVKIVMHRIEAHEAGVGASDDRIEVRTVVVHLATCGMDDVRCFGDVLFEETERVGIRDHHRSSILSHHGSQGIEVESTICTARDLDDVVASHRR